MSNTRTLNSAPFRRRPHLTSLMMELARVTRGLYYGLKLTDEPAPATDAEKHKDYREVQLLAVFTRE